jgi:hypothetical protein
MCNSGLEPEWPIGLCKGVQPGQSSGKYRSKQLGDVTSYLLGWLVSKRQDIAGRDGAHPIIPATQEGEAEGSQVQGQPELYSETLSQSQQLGM